jgi:hypothetical protein
MPEAKNLALDQKDILARSFLTRNNPPGLNNFCFIRCQLVLKHRLFLFHRVQHLTPAISRRAHGLETIRVLRMKATLFTVRSMPLSDTG